MMLFVNPIREYLGAVAPDPLAALISVAEIAVTLLTVAYLIARLAVLPTFPVDDIGEFFSDFFFAIILASIAWLFWARRAGAGGGANPGARGRGCTSGCGRRGRLRNAARRWSGSTGHCYAPIPGVNRSP